MLSIDQYAYLNKLRQVHPFEKFVFSCLSVTLCLVLGSVPLYMAVIAVMSGLILLKARVPWQVYLKMLTLPIGFLIIGIITIIFDWSSGIGSQDFFRWQILSGSLGIYKKDLMIAVDILGKSMATVTCLYFLSLTTPMVEIMFVLKKLKVPSIFTELMGLVYRFIYVLVDTAHKITVSQSSRLGYRSIRTSCHSLGLLISSLFGKAFRKSEMLFTALSARGFTGDLRVLDPEYSISLKNLLMIGVFEVALLILSLYYRGYSL